MGAVAMGSAYATISFEGDKEILEGAEGYIVVYGTSTEATHQFENVSEAVVKITVDPANPRKAIIVPEKVSVDTESTIRITVGSETIDHTFKVVNEAEPEQANGKTIAQCTFHHKYKGHAGIAGTGTFSFDKRTVSNIFMGSKEFSDQDAVFPVDKIVSTTRVIEGSDDSGLAVFKEDDGSLRIVQGSFVTGGFYRAWYAGLGYEPGYAEPPGRGAGLYHIEGWSNSDPHYTYYPSAGFSFSGNGNYANDSSARGSWYAKYPVNDNGIYSEGYFDCNLSDVGNMPACGGTFNLKSNQWQQISLPCLPSRSKVSDLFANIRGAYGTDWVVYEYITEDGVNQYAKLAADDTLKQGKGYWIINKSDGPVTLAMPQGSIPTLVTQYPGCTGEKGCFEISLATNASENQWSMIGFPFDAPGRLSGARIAANSGDCDTADNQEGCPPDIATLDTANRQDLVQDQLWNYVDADTGYAQVKNEDTLKPWQGYWSVTLPSADAAKPIKLVIPKP